MSSHFAKTATKLGQVLYTKTNVHGSSEMAQITPISKPSKHGLKKTTAIPCEIRGEVYPSFKAAAEALGISPTAITRMLNRKGTLETVGLGKNGPIGKTNAAKEITLWGETFASRTEAAKALGMTRECFSKRISKSASQNQKHSLMLSVMQYKQKRAKL